ncbi:MAG: type II toxin-antitoxin system VapC family toxin [Caldilineaceae bacterium]
MWDANILRHFAEKHPTLQAHLTRVSWSEIALPSVVMAEVLRGRCEFALKATVEQAPFAHQQLLVTQQLLQKFHTIPFDHACAEAMRQLQRTVKTNKRYADAMIAATAIAGGHIVVTRNIVDFRDLLSAQQLANWIDSPPTN